MKFALVWAALPLAITASVSAPASAAESLQVTELDVGSCWAADQSQDPESSLGGWKVASFNDQRNFYVVPDDHLPPALTLQSLLTDKLKPLVAKFGPSHYEVFLYCSGGGHLVLINVYEGDTPVCAWAKASTQTNFSLELKAIQTNPHPKRGAPCFGYENQALMIGVKSGVSLADVEAHLRGSAALMASITEIRKIEFVHSVELKLADALRFHEAGFEDELRADDWIRANIDFLELEPKTTFAGEGLKLFDGSYAGF